MSDFLVLEEDGTSRLELEESTDDLLLEEGGWIDHVVNVDDFVNDGTIPDPGIEDSATPFLRTDVNYTLNPEDSVAVADAASTPVQGHGRAPADTVAISDSAVTKSVWTNYTVTPTDAVTVSDVQNVFENTTADAYQDEDAAAAPFELEEGTGFIELEETGGWTNHVVTPADSVAVSDSTRVVLAPGRFSQAAVEVLVSPSDAVAHFSQAPVEVVVRGADQKARFSQTPVEVLVREIPDQRVSQVPVEVVTAPVWDERQAYYDAIRLDYPDGLWRLDDVSGNWVDSTGTHPFIPYGSVTYQVDGPTGSDWPAMGATGGGGASQPSYSTVMDNISFETWFKYDAISADNQVIFANVNGSAGWALTLNQNGKLQVVVNGSTYLAESTQALTAGTWYHIVVERRNGQWRYYINGEIDTPNAGTATPSSAVTTMQLFGSNNMTASMATASYWERALTGSEIAEHYAAVFPPPPDQYEEHQAHFEARVIDPLDSSTWVVDDMTSPPLAVMFFGTNWSELDTIVTTGAKGIFRGSIGRDPDTNTIHQHAISPVFPGDGQRVSETQAICMSTTSGTIHYSATVTLTETGFECAFDNVGVGVVIALILKEANNCCMIHGGSGEYEIGFRGMSHVSHGHWSAVGNRTNMHGCWFGGGQWISENGLNFEGGGITMHCYPTSQGPGQYLNELTHRSLSNGMFGTTAHFLGPFMVASNTHALVPESYGGRTIDTSVDFGPGTFVVWDGYSNVGYLSKPATAADDPIETILNTPAFGPSCVITYSISDTPSGQHTGGHGSGGFGIALADGFRFACLVDGGRNTNTERAAYQSLDHAWISSVDASGVHAGDLEFTDDGFIAETVLDSFPADTVLSHAMGFPEIDLFWLPHMSRTDR